MEAFAQIETHYDLLRLGIFNQVVFQTQFFSAIIGSCRRLTFFTGQNFASCFAFNRANAIRAYTQALVQLQAQLALNGIYRQADQLCATSISEVLTCATCATCILGMAGTDCCDAADCATGVCGNNFCVDSPSNGGTPTFVLGWYGDDVYSLSVAGPIASLTVPIASLTSTVNIPSFVSENAIAIPFDSIAVPGGSYGYTDTLISVGTDVVDPWALYVFEDGEMTIATSGQTGSASGTFEYGGRVPSVSPSMMPSQSAVPSSTTMPTNMERRVLAEEDEVATGVLNHLRVN